MAKIHTSLCVHFDHLGRSFLRAELKAELCSAARAPSVGAAEEKPHTFIVMNDGGKEVERKGLQVVPCPFLTRYCLCPSL